LFVQQTKHHYSSNNHTHHKTTHYRVIAIGKSTQLPAYILEDSPGLVKIVVAQPRRLAATGVATRVAQERGETVGRSAIGYIVRGDTAMNDASTRLVFCTTGILLRQLQNDKALSNITHIVIDEVHERNLDSDVLLGILKERLDEYPQLRVILMSATLDKDKFAQYWGVMPPHIHIPGRTFPVQDFMLEDVLKVTGYIPRKNRNKGRDGNGNAWSDTDIGDENEIDGSSPEALVADEDDVLPDGLSMSELLNRIDETTVDFDLMSALVVHLVKQKTADDDGSILIFLAGVPEISKGIDTLRRSCKDLPVLLLPLHGGLQPKEQNSVFRKPDNGKTKIILSTNVAETSVTIPDCTIVVDTYVLVSCLFRCFVWQKLTVAVSCILRCREKQSSFDPVNRMPMLVEQFASKASLKQRVSRLLRRLLALPFSLTPLFVFVVTAAASFCRGGALDESAKVLATNSSRGERLINWRDTPSRKFAGWRLIKLCCNSCFLAWTMAWVVS
jgi:ATP-dependent RNA helicase DHX57